MANVLRNYREGTFISKNWNGKYEDDIQINYSLGWNNHGKRRNSIACTRYEFGTWTQ
jgi:hypothetical protein